MINHWWVTRPQRRLNRIPEILAVIDDVILNHPWHGERNIHVLFEDALENAGIKKAGDRRDGTGGGGRTYYAWLISLGLIFIQESSGQTKFTLAGEAILAGDSSVNILKNQILKYQFPSSFSISKTTRSRVNERFKIRPFRFLLRLLYDSRINYLTEEEITKIIILEATNETDRHYEYIVSRIIEFRSIGDRCISRDVFEEFPVKADGKLTKISDVSNTIVNWLEYTQLARREDDNKIRISEDKRTEVQNILNTVLPFIDRPDSHEYFQRKFGVDPKHSKDTRNLNERGIATEAEIRKSKIVQALFTESIKSPITRISAELIERISNKTGYPHNIVEDIISSFNIRGALDNFMVSYKDLAYRGREKATEFELATTQLFKEVFNYEAHHIGAQGNKPDICLLSHSDKYIGIIDTKAYSQYSISNDHRNRMVYNYIEEFRRKQYPLAFFSYIAGGFGPNINNQIRSIAEETTIGGSAVNVSNIIELARLFADPQSGYNHDQLKAVFSLNRQVLLADL